jgi:hypothetical protein
MKKVLRVTESELTSLIKRVIQEQPIKGQYSSDYHPKPTDHPTNNPLWKEMVRNVTGEGVETIKFVPNKMLVIDAFGNKYTITKG